MRNNLPPIPSFPSFAVFLVCAAFAASGCEGDAASFTGSTDGVSRPATELARPSAELTQSAQLDRTAQVSFPQVYQPVVAQTSAACDVLTPSQCAFPFPNSYYLREDSTSNTGYRVNFVEASLPYANNGIGIDPVDLNLFDGFSPAPPIMTHFPDLSLEGVPGHWDIDRSLEADSPTVLINANTGALIPHFAELDESGDDPTTRAFMIWPASSLEFGTPYIVAMRGLVDQSGALIEPSEAFRALRDGETSGDPDVEARREGFERLFGTLEAAGIQRANLQLAWDFITVSQEGTTGWMIHMREDAMARVGPGGPQYKIDEVQDYPYENVYRKIYGRMRVPLYLTTAAPSMQSRLVIGSDGLPEANGWTWVPFLINIPRSLGENPHPELFMQYGHGLFGSREEITYGWSRDYFDKTGYVACAVEWWGMAELDLPTVVRIMMTDASKFVVVTDRLQQGLVNALMLTELMLGTFASDPAMTVDGKLILDPERRAYYGNSQGGILGGSFMALSQRITRGVLGVGGGPYALMLPRSADFAPYFDVLKVRYSNHMDVMQLIALFQMTWDRSEPSGYMRFMTDNPLPGSPTHQVLFHVGVGDAQVPNLSSQYMARSAGVPLLVPYTQEIWGMEQASEPLSSAYVEFDFGAPAVPVTNVPPDETYDTHELPRRTDEALEQIDTFIRTGEVLNYCDGACFYDYSFE